MPPDPSAPSTPTPPASPPAMGTMPQFPSLDALQALPAEFQSIIQSGSGVSDVLNQIASSFGGANTGILSFITSSGSMVGASEKIKTSLASYPALISGMTSAISGAGNSYTDFFTRSSAGMAGLEANQSAAMQASSQLFSGAKDSPMIARLQQMQGSWQGLSQIIGGAAGNITSSALAGENLAQSLIRSADATGTYGQLMESLGPNMEGSVNMVASRMAQVNEIGRTTLMPTLAPQVFTDLLQYRGALDSVVSASDAGTAANRSLGSSILEVSSGTGAGIKEVEAILQMLLRSSNVQSLATEGAGAKAMALASTIRQAGDQMGLSYGQTRGQVERLTSSFKLQGDTAQALLGPLAATSSRLQQVGLNSSASSDLATTFVQSMSRMTMAQKMFISEMTGGAGGAAGAFEIESLMRKEGGAAEVFSRVQDTLQQQLGEIVTLEDVEMGGDTAAAERLSQLQILKASPLGANLGDDELSRLLDSLSQRQVGEKEGEMFDPAAALQEMTARGQMAISRTVGPQTAAQLAGLQASAIGVPGGYNIAQLLMGNSPGGMDIKRDLGARLDTGTISTGVPEVYQEGLSSENMRLGIDAAASLGSVSVDALKVGAVQAGQALSDLAETARKLFSGTEESASVPTSALPALPAPLSTTVQQMASQPTTATATSPSAAAPSPEPTTIPFLCGGCHQTYFAQVEQFTRELAQRVKTSATAAGTTAPAR